MVGSFIRTVSHLLAPPRIGPNHWFHFAYFRKPFTPIKSRYHLQCLKSIYEERYLHQYEESSISDIIPWEWVSVVESTPAYGLKLRIPDNIVHLDLRRRYPTPLFRIMIRTRTSVVSGKLTWWFLLSLTFACQYPCTSIIDPFPYSPYTLYFHNFRNRLTWPPRRLQMILLSFYI